MPKTIDTPALIAWMQAFAAEMAASKQALSELDSASGDADHGANMDRGMVAVSAMIDAMSGLCPPGEFLKNVGLTIVDTVGGSSGALYGTIFLRMAAGAGAAAHLDGPTMSKALHGAVQGVVDRGRARAGDKTMYDALAPAADAFDAALAEGSDIAMALKSAEAAAAAGAKATEAMRARRGKSSYVGEKSIGAVDPGAASIALLIQAAAATLGGD